MCYQDLHPEGAAGQICDTEFGARAENLLEVICVDLKYRENISYSRISPQGLGEDGLPLNWACVVCDGHMV